MSRRRPLDDPAHLFIGEHDRGQLAATAAGAEHLRGRVQPDLLDARIVQHLLQGPEAADPGGDLRDHRVVVEQDRHLARGGATVVVGEHLADQRLELIGVHVQAAAPDQLARLALDDGGGVQPLPSPAYRPVPPPGGAVTQIAAREPL
jgi:hypothetical protein